MNTKKLTILLVSAIALLLVAVVAVGAVTLVYVGGGFYPKNAQALDLRERELTVEDFEALTEKMPDCYMLWNVPFRGGKLESNTQSITLTSVTAEDVAALDYLTELRDVDATGCTDYALLRELQNRHPNATVRYQMTISGVTCDQDTESLALQGLSQEDGALLSYLPKLQKVAVSDCEDYAFLRQLQEANPQWNLTYTVALGDKTVAWDTQSLDAENLTYEDVANALAGLPNLQTLTLRNPDAQGQELLALREAYPDVDIHWQVELYGQTVTDETTELDISGNQISTCEEVEAAVACLPNLEKLIMSDCGIDSETMAAFRERQRDNYKVVWTVYLGSKCKVRTDDTYFMPIKQGEYYFQDSYSHDLMYCEDMVCIDLGHHKIHNIDFVAYMPHLKYLIIAHTEVQHVDPIVNCQELIYLEVDWSTIRDYTPIAQLKNLEDLNLNETYCDITPILSMTWLKNLWAPGRSYTVRQQLIEALPNTHLQLTDQAPAGEGWRNLQNYYDMRDCLGMYYMD